METHNNLAERYLALVVQDIVDTASKIPCDDKEANVSNSYIQLPKRMKVVKCSPVLPLRFEPTVEE